nr:ComF family protein [Cytophagales bacterium]
MRFNVFEDFLTLIFPETCVVCRRSLFAFEDHLCRVCQANLPVASYHLFPESNDLKTKIMGLAHVEWVMSYLKYSKKGLSQQILHQLKYKNKPGLGRVLGRLYGQLLIEQGYQTRWHSIIPVPLHTTKLRRRGYNQSQCFAEGLAETLAITVVSGLKRTANTDTQTRKSRIQRWENVSEVFELTPQTSIYGKRILLVDDVMTTGATLAACACVLRAANPEILDLAVIAAGKG